MVDHMTESYIMHDKSTVQFKVQVRDVSATYRYLTTSSIANNISRTTEVITATVTLLLPAGCTEALKMQLE